MNNEYLDYSGLLRYHELLNKELSNKVNIDEYEQDSHVIAVALNDLNENKLDITAYTPTDLSNYYTKSEIDNMIGDIETLLAAI